MGAGWLHATMSARLPMDWVNDDKYKQGATQPTGGGYVRPGRRLGSVAEFVG